MGISKQCNVKRMLIACRVSGTLVPHNKPWQQNTATAAATKVQVAARGRGFLSGKRPPGQWSQLTNPINYLCHS